MQANPSFEIVAFVEGAMEQMFINQNFGYVRCIKIGNGSSWTVDRISADIVRKYRVIKRNPSRIVIWFDRERRSESAEEISNTVRNYLKKENFDEEKTIIIINDRCVENLILSDENLIINQFGDSSYKYKYTGIMGKPILKEMYKKKEINYKETVHGVKILKSLRVSNVERVSSSMADIYKNFQRKCWWI